MIRLYEAFQPDKRTHVILVDGDGVVRDLSFAGHRKVEDSEITTAIERLKAWDAKSVEDAKAIKDEANVAAYAAGFAAGKAEKAVGL